MIKHAPSDSDETASTATDHSSEDELYHSLEDEDEPRLAKQVGPSYQATLPRVGTESDADVESELVWSPLWQPVESTQRFLQQAQEQLRDGKLMSFWLKGRNDSYTLEPALMLSHSDRESIDCVLIHNRKVVHNVARNAEASDFDEPNALRHWKDAHFNTSGAVKSIRQETSGGLDQPFFTNQDRKTFLRVGRSVYADATTCMLCVAFAFQSLIVMCVT
jgi:hypothetical protein